MKVRHSMLWLSILAGALIASASASVAQQKTAKECDAEWQADKAAIQASGKTKKDYVAACRQGGGHATARPASKASAPETRTTAQPPAARAPSAGTRSTQSSAKASPRDARTAAPP